MADKQTWERKIIEAGYREMAKRHHPDKGGEPEEMAALNQAVKNLRALDVSALSYEEFTGAPQHVPTANPIVDGLNDLADKVLEIFEQAKKPRAKRRR